MDSKTRRNVVAGAALAGPVAFAIGAAFVPQASAAVIPERLAAFKAAGIVDADTIAYLPLDGTPGTTKADHPLDNYADGEHAMTALLDVAYANSASLSDSVLGPDRAIRAGWTNAAHVANAGSLGVAQQSGAANGLSAAVYFSDAGHVILSDSFTFEALYKWNAKPTGDLHYFVSQHTKNESGGNAAALQGTMLQDGRLRISALNGTYDPASGDLVSTASVSGETSYSCLDGRWHHVAVVYDKAAGTIRAYVDYRRILDAANFRAVTKTSGYQKALIVGNGYYSNSKYANTDGGLDEVRLTRRALAPEEFLFPEAFVETDTLAWVSFEGGELAAWPYECVRHAISTNAALSFSGDTIAPNSVRTRGGDVLRRGNAKSLSTTGGAGGVLSTAVMAEWLGDPILQGAATNSLTVEFFAKGTGEAASYALVAGLYSPAAHEGSGGNVAAVRMPNQNTVGNPGYYQGHCYGSSGSQATLLLKTGAEMPQMANDGKWHHVAVTFESGSETLTLTGYCDYRQVNQSTTKNALFDLSEALLRIGNGLPGLIDEIRISKGVLPVGKFLYRGIDGTMVVFR